MTEMKRIKRKLLHYRIYSIIITIGFIALGFLYIRQYYMNKSNQYAASKLQSFSKTITSLVNISNELETENLLLCKTNEKYWSELKTFREREELYDKYKYAIVADGKRTDITYDQLKTLSKLVKNAKVNDEDLLLAWIMTESGGDETCTNPKSTAKGYGQILDGTSKFVYTKLMKKSKDSWDNSIAFDGNQNLELMSKYIDYLYENNHNDLMATIRKYRGRHDVSGYVGRMNEYLASTGKSVESIAQSLKK